jgi:hypothetical protein
MDFESGPSRLSNAPPQSVLVDFCRYVDSRDEITEPFAAATYVIVHAIYKPPMTRSPLMSIWP